MSATESGAAFLKVSGESSSHQVWRLARQQPRHDRRARTVAHGCGAGLVMGRTHATSGAVSFLVVLPGFGLLGVDASGVTVIAGVIAATGGAMLPDLDHPHATVAQSAGPASRAIATGVSLISGGHRNGTHSVLGIVVFTGIGALFNIVGGLWLGLWLAFLFAVATTALRLKMVRPTVLHTAVCLAGGAALVTTSALEAFPIGVLPAAVGVGVVAHLAGDILTREGCPLLWPLSRRRVSLMHFTTDGLIERLVIGPGLGVIALVLVWQQTGGLRDRVWPGITQWIS